MRYNVDNEQRTTTISISIKKCTAAALNAVYDLKYGDLSKDEKPSKSSFIEKLLIKGIANLDVEEEKENGK